MIDYEAILESEGMPAELRMLTEGSRREGHSDGLICVSMQSNKEHCDVSQNQGLERRSDWSSWANYHAFGETTAFSDTDTATHYRLFCSLVWESGVTGDVRGFLLDYGEHGFVSKACRRFGFTRRRGLKLIEFIWQSAKENNNGG